MKRFQLGRRRSAVSFAIVGLIPLLAVPYLVTTVSSTSIREQIDDRVLSTAQNAALYVGQVVAGRIQVADAIARRPDLIAATTKSDVTSAQTALSGVIAGLPAGSSITLVSRDGTELASAGSREPFATPVGRATWFSTVMGSGGAFVFPVSAKDGPLLAVATPAAAQVSPTPPQILGVVVVTTPLTDVRATLLSFAQSQHVELAVGDNSGTVVVGTHTPVSVEPADPAIQAAVAGHDSVRESTPNGEHIVTAFSAPPNVKWPVSVSLSATSALAAVEDLRTTVLLIVLGLAVLFGVGLKIIGRALRRQDDADAALRAAHGQLSTVLEQVEHASLHDPLTGLPNRKLFADRLETMIKLGQRHHRAGAVVLIDLDDFKRINDTMGHLAGDELLRVVASRITACLRDSDTPARLGGDEFAIVVPETGAAGAAPLVARILAAFNTVATIDGQRLVPSGSVGVAYFPRDGTDLATLLRKADARMYEMKRARA